MSKVTKRIFSMLPLALPAALYSAPAEKPNVLVILMDDMGYSDISCFGGEINTPNIDRLATNGVKFAQMYNTAKCYPSRSCLLTGVYYQRTSQDFLPNTATLGEVLRPAGYNTWWTGKNHAIFNPVNRGFDHYYGLIGGAENHFNPGSTNSPGQPMPAISINIDGGLSWWDDNIEMADFVPQTTNFYDTDAFTDRALQWLDASNGDGKPFFLYMAYMSPHWPLHAWPEDIAKYDGVYTNGYAAVRQARYDRQVAMGLVDPVTAPLPPFDSTGLLVWENLSSADRQKEVMRMQIHAAMVDRVDQNIGRLISKLEAQGRLTNTVIMFFSDNGACAEIPTGKNVDPNAPMGSVATYEAIGPTWAQVCNTPLRKWKTDSFEGGICTPMVVSWPAGFSPKSGWIRDPVHMIDVMPTLLEVTGATYPGESTQPNIPPVDGVSLVPAFAGNAILRNDPLFFYFLDGSAVRDGQWKIVRDTAVSSSWELYGMDASRTETSNQAGTYPALVTLMDAKWRAWWKNCTGQVLAGSNYNFYTLTASSASGSGSYFTNGQQAAISANAPATGKTFVRWIGTTQYVASDTASNTTVTMPASNIALAAIYTNLPGWYLLTVNSGRGGGMCSNGLPVAIAASNAPVGMGFVQWIGDTQYMASATASNTTVTMPAQDISLTATYTILPGWNLLTVNNGTGSGLYTNGQQVVIATSNALTELVFDRWIGDTQYVDNVTSMDTLLTMPTNAITLTATYVSSGTYLAEDDFSSGSWNGGNGWSNGWTVVPTATYGTVIELNTIGSITRTFSTPIPKATLSFDWDLDRISTSQSGIVQVYSNGTWYTVWSYNVKGGDDGGDPDLMVTTTTNLSAYGSISQIRFKLNGIETFHRFWIDNIRVSSTSGVPAYVLTVNSGSGDGSYTNGRQVAIQAYPMSGKTFYRWTGATQYVASVTSANSTVAMPASNISVAATYADAYYALTVNNGTGGGGIYTNGTRVAIAANAPADGKAFDKWIGDTQYVDNASSLNTTVTIPAQAVSLTATYADVNYSLTINYGTGGGLSYTNEQRVAILANTPADGKAFDKWTGDTQYLDNASSASTWMTMPARDVVLTATYVDVYYTLTVNGAVVGSFPAGTVIPICADDPPPGLIFDHWVGDTAYLADSNAACTTVASMPASNITLTATYKVAYVTLTGQGSNGGSVSPPSTNMIPGEPAIFVITASNYYRIAAVFTNGGNIGVAFNNSSTNYTFIWTNMQAVTVTAAFVAQVVTNPAASGANVPYSWMAGYGLTNGGATFDQAAVVDQDGDGLTAWQEYIAGTDPTNATSGFKAAQNTRNTISWSPVSGRVYSVYWATNLLNGFQPLETNILYPQGNYTNLNAGPRVNLYQIKVRME